MSRRRIYWICQIVGWFTYVATFLITSMVGTSDLPRGGLAATLACAWGIAIVWTHVYRLAIRRWEWVRLGFGHLLPRVIAASMVLGVAITASATPAWLFVVDRIGPIASWAPTAVLTWTSSVFVWSAVYFGVHYFERAQKLEVAQLQLALVAKDAQLHGLMAQLQPHFLFNCLNSVRGLIIEDPAKAQATVTALSSLMRYSLQAAKDSTVPLATELDMVRTYLALETVRFDDRLRSEIDIADSVAGLPVPAMLVQSLVENGVKHGIERTPAGGTIRVAAWRERGALRIRVVNPGRLGASSPSTQIGLANARERLRLLYGPEATLALGDDDRTVTAEVSIPLAEVGQARSEP
jgi:hypothetical protein